MAIRLGGTYEAVAAHVRVLLRERVLEPGQHLPSVRSLSLELDVAPGTVQTAYRLLQGQGVIRRDPVSNRFIVAEAAELEQSDDKIIAAEIHDLVERLTSKGFAKDRILAALRSRNRLERRRGLGNRTRMNSG